MFPELAVFNSFSFCLRLFWLACKRFHSTRIMSVRTVRKNAQEFDQYFNFFGRPPLNLNPMAQLWETI